MTNTALLSAPVQDAPHRPHQHRPLGDVLVTHQAARELKISVKGVQLLLSDGRLRGYKLGDAGRDPWLIERADLDDYKRRVRDAVATKRHRGRVPAFLRGEPYGTPRRRARHHEPVEHHVISEEEWQRMHVLYGLEVWTPVLAVLEQGKIVSLPAASAEERRTLRSTLTRKANAQGLRISTRSTETHVAVRRVPPEDAHDVR